MELGSYTERQRQRDPLNPQQQQNRYCTAFAHPPAEYNGSHFDFYQERGTALRSAFAGGAAGGTEGAEGWPLHASDAAVDPASAPDTSSNSSTRGGLNGSYSPYDVAYRGQAYTDNAFDQETLQPPHSKFSRVRLLIAILAVAGLSLCFFFQRRRALQSSSRTAIDACDLDKEPACREYGFFDGFDGRLMLNELTAAMRKAAGTASLQLPERFRTILISLEWGEPNGRLLEQCELAREACEARSFPQTATVHWPIYGQNVNPFSLPAHERDALAANFTLWDGDNLEQKVQVLNRVTHNFLELPGATTDIVNNPGDSGVGEKTSHNMKKKENSSNGRRMADDVEEHAIQEQGDDNASAITGAAVTTDHEKQRSRTHASESQQLHTGNGDQERNFSVSSTTVALQQTLPSSQDEESNVNTVTVKPMPKVNASAMETTATTPLVSVVHCHHGKDRTAVIVGAYKMRFLQHSFEQIIQENFAMGQDLMESVNALMWYCLYLEKAPAENGAAGAGFRPKCFDAIAAYPHISFLSNGKAPRTPPGVLPPESSVPRPLRPVDVAARPPTAAAAPTSGAARETPAANGEKAAVDSLPPTPGSVAGETAAVRERLGPNFRAQFTRGQMSEAVPAAAAAEPPQTRSTPAAGPPASAGGVPFPDSLSTVPMAPAGGTPVGSSYVTPTTQAFQGRGAPAATQPLYTVSTVPAYPSSAASSPDQALYGRGNDASAVTSSSPTNISMGPPSDQAGADSSAAERPEGGVNGVEGVLAKRQQAEVAQLPYGQGDEG